MIEKSLEIFKCLADKSRLKIIHNLLKEPMYVELLSERLELSPSTISFHLKKMENAGIVNSKKEQYYVIYFVNKDLFEISLKKFIDFNTAEGYCEKNRENEYKNKIIKTFFEYNKLKSIPVQRKKKLIVFEEITKKIEKNHKYTERELHLILSEIYEDFITLKKELIIEDRKSVV